MAIEKEGRIGTYFSAADAARAGVNPGYHINEKHPIFQPDFNPLRMGLVVSPDVPLNLGQVNKAQRGNIFAPDMNNIAPRFGFSWQPWFTDRVVIRGGYGIYFERPSGSFKTDLQLVAVFHLPECARTARHGQPVSKTKHQSVHDPARSADGDGRERDTLVAAFQWHSLSGYRAFCRRELHVYRPVHQDAVRTAVDVQRQYEPLRNLLDIRYVGTRGVGLMAKVNLAQAVDPRVTPINGFTDIRNRTGALINPDFFVPSEYLGLGRQGGYRLRSNYGMSTYHGLQVSFRRRFQHRLLMQAAYTWAKTIDNISSDGGVMEHDARNSQNNRGVADFDRTHRLTVAYVYQMPSPWRNTAAGKWLLGNWSLNGMAALQSGTPFSIVGANTANAYFAQVARVRVDLAPGRTIESARKEGNVQDRVTAFFDPTAFVNSEDRWGNSGRNILRGPWQRQFDFALAKLIPINEGRSIEARLEAFNAFNQPTFSNPNSTLPTVGVGTMGNITSTVRGTSHNAGSAAF
ncbi:MAG: hypothetical protein WKF37_23585 [Bryobacteraceae bacterium]